MEPQLPAPRPSHEMGPLPTPGERSPGGHSVEQNPGLHVPERHKEKTETRETKGSSQGGDPTFVAPPLPPLPPAQVQSAAPVQKTNDPVDDNPLVAADDDLIEKEWVERAKKIIAETRQDPYRQEQEVSKLQADYLKKRYGKEVKLPTE